MWPTDPPITGTVGHISGAVARWRGGAGGRGAREGYAANAGMTSVANSPADWRTSSKVMSPKANSIAT